MKNLFKVLLILVLAVFTIGFYSVKAEELELSESENIQTEVANEKTEEDKPVVVATTESSKGEETKVEQTPVINEVTDDKEVVVEETNTNNNTNTEVPTVNNTPTNNDKGDDDGLDQDVEDLVHTSTHNHCVIFINNVTGKEIQRGCTPSGTSGAKTFPKGQYSLLNDFSLNGYTYVFNGWYDADGNLLTTEKGVRVPLSDPGDSCKVTYVYAYFDAIKEPIYTFNLFDYISDTSHSWDNTNGSWVNPYTFTFKTPTARNHYMFLYYKFGDQTFNPGDKYSHNITGQGAGSEITEDFYAWWQADVTLKLYDGTKLLGSKSDFESVTISDILSTNPTKSGYRFLGWVDAEDNDVDADTVYYPDEASAKPTPKEICLYAKWLKVVNISVTKTWDDNNNSDQTRPDSVTVHVTDENNEIVDTIELSEENNWTYTFEVPELDENTNTPINYNVTEDKVNGYTTYISGNMTDGFVIKNVLHYEDVTVTKVWDDFDNEDGLRPDSVTIYLYADGEEVTQVTLSEDNDWTTSFGDLDMYSDGKEIIYTISEDKVEYYSTDISGDAASGFVVTNTEIMGQGGTPENPDDDTNNNPNTGDTIINSIIMLIISLSGFASGIIYLKKSKLVKNN